MQTYSTFLGYSYEGLSAIIQFVILLPILSLEIYCLAGVNSPASTGTIYPAK